MLTRFNNGEITFYGNSYNDLNNRQKMKILKKEFGIIFQDFGLIEEWSVYKNLVLCL